jgi:tRNA 2-thiouridine synthesizing protein A
MAEHHLDARGLICPLPVLKARKILLNLAAGDILRVAVTDATAPDDFALFCRESGHVLMSVHGQSDSTEIIVKRGQIGETQAFLTRSNEEPKESGKTS